MANEWQKTSWELIQEAPKDALSEVMEKLEISPEDAEKIKQQVQWEKKERCQLSLEDILTEVEEQKLWPTDRDKKIQDTLDEVYSIKIENKKASNSIKEKEKRYEILWEKLDAVKNLDQVIVSEELARAKAEKPLLPQETKLAIAKASNIDPSQVDEAIKKGDNPQIQNLVDTYYLTNPIVQSAIESRLPEERKWEANIAFQELRGSAREFGILSPFTEKDLPSRLSDKSDKTQQEVISTFNSINQGNPNTLITRTGDKLNWESPDGKKYEIDMAVRPPRLTKSRNGLSIQHNTEALSVEEMDKLWAKKSAKERLSTGIKEYQKDTLNYVETRQAEYALKGETPKTWADGKLEKQEINIYHDIFEKENAELQNQYETAERSLLSSKAAKEKGEFIDTMEHLNREMKWKNLDKLIDGNVENRVKIDKMLEVRTENLRRMKQTNTTISSANDTLGKLNEEKDENKNEQFDRISDNNLSLLTDLNFHKIWPRAQETLDRVIAETNRGRDEKNKIKLNEKSLDTTDKTTLQTAIEKLGGKPGVFQDADRLARFRLDIDKALALPADHPQSLESQIKKPDENP